MAKQSAFDALMGTKTPRVSYNTGTLLDMANGRFLSNGKGAQLLDGGLASITSFFGKSQTYKSALMFSHVSRIMANYPDAQALIWENENSIADTNRFDDLSGSTNSIVDRINFYKGEDCAFLEDFDDIIKSIADDRIKNKDSLMMKTPFMGVDGQPIYQMRPMLVCIDSFSAANTRMVFKEFGKKDLDDKKNAREFMVEGGIKTRFFMKLPKLVASAGITFFSSGHLAEKGGQAGPMDKFDTPVTPNMSKDHKINRVGSQYIFLSNNAIESTRITQLANASDRTKPLYGFEGLDRSDLLKVKCKLTKGKSQQGSGFELPHICSNKYGIDNHIEAYDFVKENYSAVFGTAGNKTDPITGTKFTNNSVRNKFEADAKFARALQIIGHYAYVRSIWIDYRCPLPSVEEFTDALLNCNSTLKDELVESTGIWEFVDATVKSGKNYMSILDVIEKLTTEGAFKK